MAYLVLSRLSAVAREMALLAAVVAGLFTCQLALISGAIGGVYRVAFVRAVASLVRGVAACAFRQYHVQCDVLANRRSSMLTPTGSSNVVSRRTQKAGMAGESLLSVVKGNLQL